MKTSGSPGLHVHAPLPGPIDGKAVARALAVRLARERPDEVVGEVRRSARAGRVYVDWLQDDPSRQTVAPYSLRGVPRPAVPTRVGWDEVERPARAGRPELLLFGPADVLARIEQHGDLFATLA